MPVCLHAPSLQVSSVQGLPSSHDPQHPPQPSGPLSPAQEGVQHSPVFGTHACPSGHSTAVLGSSSHLQGVVRAQTSAPLQRSRFSAGAQSPSSRQSQIVRHSPSTHSSSPVHSPHSQPQPSFPHTLPAQSGAQVATQMPALQMVGVGQPRRH